MRIPRQLAVLAAITLGSSATFAANFAGEAAPEYPQPSGSMIERSQLRADTVDALKHDLIGSGEASVVAQPVFMASKTRAEVVAETIAALKRGLVAQGDGAVPTTTGRS
ncbi:MAG: hypothetical protein IT503_16465 [Burkholderiaceae bacterium]|nr:MAG: hypothetical protein F9K36_04150 [Burkholderiaceae bacterium]MCC7287767.1 hypothetical protein [Burkholderiaceae bacterium]